MGYRRGVFAKTPWINTIIGGVGSTITKTQLQGGILDGSVKRFEVVGNDIHCHIAGNYHIKGQGETGAVFQNNTNLTSYIDLVGNNISCGTTAFQGSIIVNAYMPNSQLGNQAFFNCTTLTNSMYGGEFIFNPSTALGTGGQLRNTRIKKLTALNLNGLLDAYGNTELIEINTPSLLKLYGNFANGCTKLVTVTHSQVTEIDGYFTFTNARKITFLDFQNATLMTGSINQPFRNMISLKTFKMNKVENISGCDNFLQGGSSLELIELKKLKTFGIVNSDRLTFSGIKLNCIIRVNIALSTINSGSPHFALTWVKANRSAIVEFYDDAGNYVSTL